jgi:hypothetical protein
MKRVHLSLMLLVLLSGLALGQKADAPAQAAPNASASQAAPAAAKTLPQAKTQEEYKAYQELYQIQDAAAVEAAANAFVAKYPSSELRYLVFYQAMFKFLRDNNTDKAVEMGRKVLALNPDEPATLAEVALMLSEKTADSDPHREDRFNEALQDAQRALQTVDTGLFVELGASLEKTQHSKNIIRSTAYSALGKVYLTKGDYQEAEKSLKQAIDLMPDGPDAITVLYYAIALDQQRKYADALMAANRAVDLTTPGSQEAKMAGQERDRLLQLTGQPAGTPAQPAKQ